MNKCQMINAKLIDDDTQNSGGSSFFDQIK